MEGFGTRWKWVGIFVPLIALGKTENGRVAGRVNRLHFCATSIQTELL